MRNYLFVGGPADGAWIGIPDSHDGCPHIIPLKPELKLTELPDDPAEYRPMPVAEYRPMKVRCGAEQVTVYALSGLTPGRIIAMLVGGYQCR